jgi:hypothetical protein
MDNVQKHNICTVSIKLTFHVWAVSAPVVIFQKVPPVQFYLGRKLHKLDHSRLTRFPEARQFGTHLKDRFLELER